MKREWVWLSLGGVATGAAYLPFDLGILLWIAFVPLLLSIRGKSLGASFLRGWWFGVVAWAVAIHWFAALIAEYSIGSSGLRILFFGVFVAYLGTMVALLAVLLRAAASSLQRRYFMSDETALTFVAVPVAIAVDGFFPQAFPSPVAMTQAFHLPFVQIIDLLGSAGLTGFVALVNVCTVVVLTTWKSNPAFVKRTAIFTLFVFSCFEAYGLLRMHSIDGLLEGARARGSEMVVAVPQASIPFSRRRSGQFVEENIAVYRNLTRMAISQGADLIVWPQNTYERRFKIDGDGRSLRIGDEEARVVMERDLPSGAAILVTSQAERRYVSILRRSDGNAVIAGFKRFPTPFSEYWPFGNRFPLLYRLTPRMNRIEPGLQNPVEVGNTQLGVYVCYDGMLVESARDLVADGAGLLINPSSDQWSRDAHTQPYQAFAMTRLRAIENRRFLIRATPNGPSTIVDPAGRVVAGLHVGEEGILLAGVVPLEVGTPLPWLRDVVRWGALLLLALILVLPARLARVVLQARPLHVS